MPLSPTELLQQAAALQDELTATRRSLHAHAETGFDLTETLALVKKKLQDMGYDPQPCGKAGLTAVIEGKRPGKTFLLRADMDALPIEEQADVPFRCESGRMHACGHDLHTAMLLGAARLLRDHQDALCGTVKLMFQPAEEIFSGSRDMLENGLLDDPKVNAALMIHVMTGMPLAPGTVIVSAPGVSAPAADYFTIAVQGKGCHGSSPNAGIDPLNAACHILIALQELHARELALDDRAVLTFGTMHAGTADNVLPDSVQMGGTLRTFDESVRAFVKERMEQISQSIAAAFRAEATLTFGSGCPTLFNDEELSTSAAGYVKELLGADKAFSVAELQKTGGQSSKSAGSEDFAYVSQRVPSIMLALAAGHPKDGYVHPQHHPKAKFDESALPTGAAVYAYTALRWLEENQV